MLFGGKSLSRKLVLEKGKQKSLHSDASDLHVYNCKKQVFLLMEEPHYCTKIASHYC